MPLSSTGIAARQRSRMAVRFGSVPRGSRPRSPSLPPSSTMAASAPSASDQSSRARPPAVVSPDTAPSMIPHLVAARRQRRCKLRLEALGPRQAIAGGQAVAEGQQPHRRRGRPPSVNMTRASAMMAIPTGPGRHMGRHGYHPATPDPWYRSGTSSHRAFSRQAGQHSPRHRPRYPAGEAVGIIGPSGSGKTSLLMVLAGLEPPARDASCRRPGGQARWTRTRWPACGERPSASCSRPSISSRR